MSAVSKTVQLQSLLQTQLNELKSDRLGIINFPHAVVIHGTQTTDPPVYYLGNLCETIANLRNCPNARIYLQVPPNHNGVVPSDFKEQLSVLNEALKMSAINGGDVVVQSGLGPALKSDSDFKRVLCLCCQCGLYYKGKKIADNGKSVANLDYRKENYVNDRQNHRHGIQGKKGAKRTRALRCNPLSGTPCKFNITLLHDRVGFFVKPRFGNAFHSGHDVRPFIRTPSRYINMDDAQHIGDVAGTNAPAGVAVQLHQARTSRKGNSTVFSQSQIRYQTRKLARQCPNPDPSNDNWANCPGSEMDQLFLYLQKSNSKYICLTEKVKTQLENGEPRRKSLLINESVQDASDVYESPEQNLQGSELNDAMADTTAFRQLRGFNDEQDMVVGIAFTTPFEAKQFTLFPYVIHVDATADTNKETFSLVTIGGKDSYGKMFVVLRAFLPCEKSWAYRWLFLTVLPKLLDNDALTCVKVAVSDGDSQEIGQLCSAIGRYFPDAYRIRCGWHIVDRGWDRIVKLPLGGYTKRKRAAHLTGRARRKPPALTLANKAARMIYRWIFSWCRPGYCISQEEFVTSYALFVDFILSDDVTSIFGEDACDLILKFVRENVLPHEDHFCYYKRHDIFHLETNTNCGLEGLQNGVKNSSNPLRPSTKLEKAVRVLENNSQIKAIDRSIAICDRANSTKLWSLTSTSASVTNVAESMINHEWESRSNYDCILTCHRNWSVSKLIKGRDSDNETSDEEEEVVSEGKEDSSSPTKFSGVIPVFSRVYSVHLDQDNILKCSCKNHERMGFPCRHISCVMCKEPALAQIFPDGFPLSSISVMWHTAYYLYGISEKHEHKKIHETYMELRCNDTSGVLVPHDIQIPEPSRVILSNVVEKPAIDQVLNYTAPHVRKCVDNVVSHAQFSHFLSVIPAGMTQQSNVNHSPWSDSEDECFTLQDDPAYTDRMMLDRDEDYALDNQDTFSRCKAWYRDASNAIDGLDCDDKEEFVQEMIQYLNGLYHRVLKRSRDCRAESTDRKGRKFAMLPPISKKQKTHGTKH